MIVVGITNPPQRLRSFPETQDGYEEAVCFIQLLDNAEQGIYYLDAPESFAAKLAPNSPVFVCVAWVTCETQEQATQVFGERLGPDEDYGFDYSVDYGKVGGS